MYPIREPIGSASNEIDARATVSSSPDSSHTKDMLEEFVDHVKEGAKDVQKAIMGGPKAMQEVCALRTNISKPIHKLRPSRSVHPRRPPNLLRT